MAALYLTCTWALRSAGGQLAEFGAQFGAVHTPEQRGRLGLDRRRLAALVQLARAAAAHRDATRPDRRLRGRRRHQRLSFHAQKQLRRVQPGDGVPADEHGRARLGHDPPEAA